MDAFGIAVLAVFAVYGMMTLLHNICTVLLRHIKGCGNVVICVSGEYENIESTVRSLMLKNPGAEIVVADNGSDEIKEILDRLCRRCTQVHSVHTSSSSKT